MLTLIRPTRRHSPASLLFMLLACTVVFWGVQYKVSLYRSSAAQRAIPAAKLLSQDERACCVTTAHIFFTGRRAHRSSVNGLFGPAALRLTSSSFERPQGLLAAAAYLRRPASGGSAAPLARGPPASA